MNPYVQSRHIIPDQTGMIKPHPVRNHKKTHMCSIDLAMYLFTHSSNYNTNAGSTKYIGASVSEALNGGRKSDPGEPVVARGRRVS